MLYVCFFLTDLLSTNDMILLNINSSTRHKMIATKVLLLFQMNLAFNISLDIFYRGKSKKKAVKVKKSSSFVKNLMRGRFK